MKNLSILFAISCLVVLSFGCSKNKAGKGGKAQINVKVINGNVNVPEPEVQVMYNARVFPGADASYSSSEIGDNRGNTIFKNLKRGDYYFYCSEIVNDTLKEGGVFVHIGNRKGETHIVIDFGADDPFNTITPPLTNP